MKGTLMGSLMLAVALSACSSTAEQEIPGAPPGVEHLSPSSTQQQRDTLVSSSGAQPPQAAVAQCDASALAGYIGRAGSAALYAELAERSGTRQQRVLSPHTAATMDYRDDRLNIRIDDAGVITGLDCG